MIHEETKQVLSVLRINYPHSFKNLSKEDSNMYLDLWAEAFKDDPVGLVVAAVKSIIYADTREFAPNIAQVKEKMHELSNPQIMTEQEAFETIKRACSNANYKAEEEFNKLSPTLKRLAGSPSQLREWAQMDSETFNSVVASNLMRSYKVISKQEHTQEMLPDSIKLMIEGLTEQKRLKG